MQKFFKYNAVPVPVMVVEQVDVIYQINWIQAHSIRHFQLIKCA